MASSSSTISISGLSHFKSHGLLVKPFTVNNQSRLAFRRRFRPLKSIKKFSVSAKYSDGSKGGGGGDFVAGFLLGGAIFGTLAYIFAPQIRRSVLNEDEYGFQRAKGPIYYDDGLEKTRQTLNEKISQLNSAIDNVSSRLRGGSNVILEPMGNDSEVETSL